MKKYIIIIVILVSVLSILIVFNNKINMQINNVKDKNALLDKKEELEIELESLKNKIEELNEEKESLNESLEESKSKLNKLED